jgi:UDP-N-acetylglucosamine--N-acetylmuramyl-(pentapeptide) pyrophosphoryl-undecaprenol N-acetylglucosamine transferase
MQKPINKIFFTGGHGATAAISVVEEIKEKKQGTKIYWVGAKHAFEGKSTTTLEYESLPKYGVTFLPLTTGRIQRKFTAWTIPSILKIPVGFFQAAYYLIKHGPQVVLSFGGYSAFPVVVAAKILAIPVVIHEQTAGAGRANLASARFADKIALAREESKKYFPKGNIIVTGNPVARGRFLVKKKTNYQSPATIFITGGSRGSQNMNRVVGITLSKLLKKYKVIHQTGEPDLKTFKDIKNFLPKDLAENYTVFSRIDPEKMTEMYGQADLIISRAGANTASDILAARRPSILIPLPISYLDEQTKNAEFAAKAGFAKIISQKDLNEPRLLEEIESIFSDYPKIMEKINDFKNPDKDAAERLFGLLADYLK